MLKTTTRTRKEPRCTACDSHHHNAAGCDQRKPHRYLIYALRDPRTAIYRYIGKSSSGISRPRMHTLAARKGERGLKANWIRSLRREGMNYQIVVLEETTKDLLNEREIWWIAKYRPLGKLTNICDGGESDWKNRKPKPPKPPKRTDGYVIAKTVDEHFTKSQIDTTVLLLREMQAECAERKYLSQQRERARRERLR